MQELAMEWYKVANDVFPKIMSEDFRDSLLFILVFTQHFRKLTLISIYFLYLLFLTKINKYCNAFICRQHEIN